MKSAIGWTGALVMLVLGFSTAASAQDWPSVAPPAAQPRLSVEGAAGLLTGYRGSMQSVAFGFAPTRNITLLVSGEQSYIPTKVDRYENGYSAERGGTERFVSAELRYAFLPDKRVSPYVLGGIGRGLSRPNVNELFPDAHERGIQVAYYGGGVRIPVGSRLDAFVDTRFLMASGAEADYLGIYFPIRAGVAWRF